MSQLFARIELRGSPDQGNYQRLHQYMESQHWYNWIDSANGRIALPHAVYQVTFNSDALDLMAIGQTLKTYIETNIWPQPLVLVIQSARWAQSAV